MQVPKTPNGMHRLILISRVEPPTCALASQNYREIANEFLSCTIQPAKF
jgi:hypothetical protein